MTGRIGLGGIYDSVWLEPYNRVRKITRRVKMAPMRSYRIRIPWWDWPVRLRPVCRLFIPFGSLTIRVKRLIEHGSGSLS
jgi:hypothetical protein